MNEITHETMNIDKCYYMKTINSTAEGYFVIVTAADFLVPASIC